MPRIPARTRPLCTLGGILAGVLTLTAATLPTPTYSGTGWKALTQHGIYSLHPGPYDIVWADTTARTTLTRYFKLPAAQVTRSVGVRINITTTLDTTPPTACPARHRIVVHYTHQPMGQPGMSQALPCHATGNNSAWGGHIRMDSEYWTVPTWFGPSPTVNEARRKDAAAHELGHILGLDHANTDIDHDGVVEAGECVAKNGLRPLMCSPNRGLPLSKPGGGAGPFVHTLEAGRFSKDFDLPGLRQLLANYTLRQS
ncbi:conserved exported protein of unknown function (plasmid) [Streptomyces ambofaciens ATCC 23877]|uniref:Peptidase M10 metallopeptidase domain-containing protein n=1 Tax=Streptomyces ambofaciens (strain ATCC 23877 / 3486 / DSM 40053 / JCM 4204 / NBRC 12836 / NRRL B-2516) TaxID=278992 RepID=A0A0K2B5Q5_STRA7|nr:hypothetical protein [Streptomyces ambofaciens]AKZ60745.1 conserved exported protein of unknown function [Streptomyces ambofaciens ATCC 23877]